MNNDNGLINPEWISNYLISSFPGLNQVNTWGEVCFFYNPHRKLKYGVFCCTIKEKDGPKDKASNLDRENVFRLNFYLSKETFLRIFGKVPERPGKISTFSGLYDFEALNTLTPHPIYGWMRWVSILNPTAATWCKIEPLLAESYALSIKKYNS